MCYHGVCDYHLVSDFVPAAVCAAGQYGRRIHWCTIISVIPLLFGFMMAGFTNKKQALHDIISGTYVISKEHQTELHGRSGYPIEP
ncbi:hypothetical protein EYB31_20670 [Paenibacillus thalictri]|uniref:RDD domain-containing protein n=1 Tax=Paenibacillus thalictri TaxID=2527873 RepID=A0A4Q9DQ63_9BACL|nr:hypothetical protein EYB31_20670 [Paenibacillus thalictri]